MKTIISLYSDKKYEIKNFLVNFFERDVLLKNDLEWKKEYENPIEMVDIIGTFIDNNDKYRINMWICLDKGFFLNVTNNNANSIIKYLFERFPY